jgi:tRNA (guanine37-N1)-methyltransferase
MSEAPCLKVPKILGEKAIVLARSLSLFNKDLKVHQVGGCLYIPLFTEPQTSHVEAFERSIPNFEVTTHRFPERVKRPLRIIDVLEDELPPHLLASLPHAIDFVGGIAVIEVPPELENHKETIGEAILKAHKRVRTVLGKAGAVEGIYRLRALEVVAGLDKTETVHREYGCVYHVDLAKAYFSPRLSHEHNRVASLVKGGETVIDMFAGVGPFSILIARKCEDVQLFAVDANPDAIRLLKRNISANNVEKEVNPILGDVREVVKNGLVGVADRVIMNLPERAIEYVDVACEAIKPIGGVMHYYEFTNAPKPQEAAKIRLIEVIRDTKRNVREISSTRTVRATAPYTWQVVVDAEIQ